MNQKLIFSLLLLLIASLLIGCTENYKGEDISFTTLSGMSQSLENYQGTVVVIDFMATWCSPCILEMEELEDVRNHYTNDEVTIISISVDSRDTQSMIQLTFADYVNQWIFGRDEYNLATKYSITAIPTIYIFDDEGSVAYSHTGLTTANTLIQQIDKLL